MTEEVNNDDVNDELDEERWFIDLDWFQVSRRSFSALAQRCLCDKCRKQLNAEEKEIPLDELLPAIKNCCSNDSLFINNQLPILESIFRLFLANGNQPLDLGELSNQLSEWRGGDTYHSTPNLILRLLKNDNYYGFQQVSD